jgi:uncharacterized membrane protein
MEKRKMMAILVTLIFPLFLGVKLFADIKEKSIKSGEMVTGFLLLGFLFTISLLAVIVKNKAITKKIKLGFIIASFVLFNISVGGVIYEIYTGKYIDWTALFSWAIACLIYSFVFNVSKQGEGDR